MLRSTINSRLVVVLFSLVASALAIGQAVNAAEEGEAGKLVADAQVALQHFMDDPEFARFRLLATQSMGIFIAPQVWEAGAGIGGSGGKGLLVIRDKVTGQWRGPAFYSMGSATLGLQLGVQKSEVVLLVMNQSGVNAMLSSGLKLGAGASVAAGPVGKGAAVSTADILSFSRAKGVFGGLSLNGEVLSVNVPLNKAYYGRAVDSVDILIRDDLTNEQSVSLLSLVNEVSNERRVE